MVKKIDTDIELKLPCRPIQEERVECTEKPFSSARKTIYIKESNHLKENNSNIFVAVQF